MKARKVLRPLSDTVSIKLVEVGETIGEAGLIAAPDTAKEKPTRGFVTAVGPGLMLESGVRSKPQVGVGDEVVFGTYAGTEVKLDGRAFALMREADILAVIEDAKETVDDPTEAARPAEAAHA